MALTNQVAYPNLISTRYGSLSAWLANINMAGNAGTVSTLGAGARSLIFHFDADLLASLHPKSLEISYSCSFKAIGGALAAITQVLGRIAVIRNFKGDPSKVLFDPVLTDNFPNVNNGGLSNGNTWQIGGVTLPRFDWDKAELIFNLFIRSPNSKSYTIYLPLLQSQDSLTVVLTPSYNGDGAAPNPNNGDPATGWSDTGAFIGTPSGFTTTQNYVDFRSLNVYNPAVCDC